jgi:hypothetical protein
MTVLTFQPQFAPLVRAGTKTQTIRAPRKRPIQSGDPLSLREWTGRPYMAPQRLLLEAVCTETAWVELNIDSAGEFYIGVNGVRVFLPGQEDAFAVRDGFVDAGQMQAWFEKTHGLPFEGTLIKWRGLPTPTLERK